MNSMQEIGPPISGIKRANFGLWISLAIASFVLYLVGLVFIMVGAEGEEGLLVFGVLLFILAAGMGIWIIVLNCIYIHRMWRMLPASYARTTPGKAVGYCFIPFFSLYWIFVALHGWSQDYNRFINETGRTHIQRVPEGLFLAMCICTIVGVIPLISYVVALPNMIMGIIVVYYICKSINAIADEGTRTDMISNTIPESNTSL